MKKAVVLIAALLMVGSLAFAMTPSFGIWGRTLFVLAGGSSEAAYDGIYQGIGPNWDGNGPRLGLHIEFNTEKVQFKVVLYFNGAMAQPAAANYGGNQNLQVMSMFGTLKFVPDLLTVYVGKNTGDGWDFFRYENANTSNNINNDNVGRMNGWGLLVAVAPKDSGFEAVVQWKMTEPSGFGWAGYGLPFATDLEIGDIMKNIQAGVAYRIPDLLKVQVGYVMLPTGGNLEANRVTVWTDTDNDNVRDPGEEYSFGNGVANGNGGLAPDTQDHNIFARVFLLMVPNLTCVLEGRFFGWENADQSNFKVQLVAAYQMDALWIGLGAWYAQVNEIGNFGVNLEGKYNLGFLTAGLGVNFGDSNMDVDGMQLKIMPWVLLNDFGTRIAFEYSMDTDIDTRANWAIPVYFTFSIW